MTAQTSEKGLIYTDIINLIVIMTTIAGLFMWNRSESRADIRMMQEIMMAIKEENKEFHGRLCAIEERNRENGK